MPRVVRGLADNNVYHIINRGNGRQEVFHKERDYEAFIDIMKEAKERYSVKLFSYCLMPNHFHMVMMPERGDELSRCMQWLMTSQETEMVHFLLEGRVAAMLYCDNMPAGEPIAETEGLEIFISQAGLAFEKALLQRRLQEMQKSMENKTKT